MTLKKGSFMRGKSKKSDKKETKKTLSPSVSGFIEWITEQPIPITASNRHDKTIWRKKASEYCESLKKGE